MAPSQQEPAQGEHQPIDEIRFHVNGQRVVEVEVFRGGGARQSDKPNVRERLTDLVARALARMELYGLQRIPKLTDDGRVDVTEALLVKAIRPMLRGGGGTGFGYKMIDGKTGWRRILDMNEDVLEPKPGKHKIVFLNVGSKELDDEELEKFAYNDPHGQLGALNKYLLGRISDCLDDVPARSAEFINLEASELLKQTLLDVRRMASPRRGRGLKEYVREVDTQLRRFFKLRFVLALCGEKGFRDVEEAQEYYDLFFNLAEAIYRIFVEPKDDFTELTRTTMSWHEERDNACALKIPSTARSKLVKRFSKIGRQLDSGSGFVVLAGESTDGRPLYCALEHAGEQEFKFRVIENSSELGVLLQLFEDLCELSDTGDDVQSLLAKIKEWPPYEAMDRDRAHLFQDKDGKAWINRPVRRKRGDSPPSRDRGESGGATAE